MQPSANRYIHHLLFRTVEDKEVIPQKLFWSAVFITFVIANVPPAKISAVLSRVLQIVSDNMSIALLSQNQDLQQIATRITESVVVPVKGCFFFLSLIVIAYPIVRCASRSRDFWCELGMKQTLLFSLGLFLALSFFVFPYSYPYGLNAHPSGLAGVGISFGRMSVAPFQEGDPMYYKRLLKPAIAHFVHLDGYVLYYLFSLICTYISIFLTVAFLESKFLGGRGGENQPQSLNPKIKWLVYLSLMTSSFILVDFQWPGYSDHLSFILLLFMATLPMTSLARLATLVLCLVNHDGMALALVPVVLFCFPKAERVPALAIVTLFYGIVAAGYGFSAYEGLRGQGTVVRGEAGSVWEAALHIPGLYFAGLFFTYKLFWVALGLVIWMLKEKATLTAICVITLFPVLLTLFAWDTTRVAGFGWLGMLIALGILLQEYKRLSRVYHYGLFALACVNLLIPSYNVVIFYKDSLSYYRYPGFYMLIDSTARQLLT